MLRKIIDALTVTFDQDNARLLNKIKLNLADLNLLNGSICVNHLKVCNTHYSTI